MTALLEPALILLILSYLILVSSSRLTLGIRVVALQGILCGFLPLMIPEHGMSLRFAAIAVVTLALKGVVFPLLLNRSLREANVQRESAPPLGYTASSLIAVLGLGVAFWISAPGRLPLLTAPASPLQMPTALFATLPGLFLIIARNNALNQVLGYLTLENGIFLTGLALALEEPLLLELGILLDVFFAVLVMGVAIFHISRAFDSIEVDQLSVLKD